MDNKSTYWRQIISDWHSSGKTQKSYCAEHDLRYATFTYWRRKLDEGLDDSHPVLRCIQVASPPPTGLDYPIEATGLTLRAGNASITVNGCLSIGSLARLASLCQVLDQEQEATNVSA